MVHDLIEDKSIPDNIIKGANLVLALYGQRNSVASLEEAYLVLESLLQELLDDCKYLEAATLLWNGNKFAIEPQYTKDIFRVISCNNRMMLCGASSVSKSYAAGAWMYLDYRRDPFYTTVKFVSLDAGHLRSNLYAHMLDLHRSASVPLRGSSELEAERWFGIREAGMNYGIQGLAFKKSSFSGGDLRGFKPRARNVSHPVFGSLSRVRILCDEAQQYPAGPFEDFPTLMASSSGVERVKIVLAFNPEPNTHVVHMAEPLQGWRYEDMETLYEWDSKSGWPVLRLDGARSENVIARREIYPGIQTYDGYITFLQKDGEGSADYFVKGRGWPPMRGAVNAIIPHHFLDSSIGEVRFTGKTIPCMSVDLSCQGEDDIIATVGRWGKANGWVDVSGAKADFKKYDDVSKKRERYCLQVDQQILLQSKNNTTDIAREIKQIAQINGVTADWIVVDKSGNGVGTWSTLQHEMGDVLGVVWSEAATQNKMLAEYKHVAYESCERIIAEMWYTVRDWMEAGCMKLSPRINMDNLRAELTGRRAMPAKNGKRVVEGKILFKKRNHGRSPDSADSLIMLPLLIRARSGVIPGRIEDSVVESEDADFQQGGHSTSDEIDTLEEDPHESGFAYTPV